MTSFLYYKEIIRKAFFTMATLKANQRMKVVENYIWFPAVHENSLMLKFEMCAPQLFLFWLLSRESGVSFTVAQSGSILTALCFELADLLLRKIVEREFQILTVMNFHEPLEIKCNFQRPSSSDSPLLLFVSNLLTSPVKLFFNFW